MKTAEEVSKTLRAKIREAMSAAAHLRQYKLEYLDINVTSEPGEPELYKEKGCNGAELLSLLDAFDLSDTAASDHRGDIKRLVRPRRGQVWAFSGGPRHDIVKSVKRGLKSYRDGVVRSTMFVAWESGMLTLTVKELWANWEHRGFFIGLKK